MSSQAILQRNRMSYEVSQPVSIKTRPHDTILQYFERQQYKQNDTMIASLATGKYFVDPEKSYISVNVAIATADGSPCTGNFGSGSVANLFKNVRIFHKSGTTITSCQNNDIYIKAQDRIIKDEFWFNTIGLQQGYVPNTATNFNLDSRIADGVQYKIKLADLHGFFRGYNSSLLPPEIIDGLRIELDLQTANQALLENAGESPIVSYELLKSNIQLCLVKVMDNAALTVYNTAQKKGLSWTYDDTFTSNKNYANNDNAITISVDKAVSVAKNCIVFSRDANAQSSSEEDGYVFDFRQLNTNWNFTVGNDLYPWKKKITEPFDAYSVCLDAYQARYGVNISPFTFFGNNGVYALNLLTDDYLEMSGVFINANKRLNFSLQKGTDETGSLWTTCLLYTKVLRVNGTNSRVDE